MEAMIAKYNEMLRQKYGNNITVEIKSYVEDDDSIWYYYTTARYGDSESAFKTAKEAYDDACIYLSYAEELW